MKKYVISALIYMITLSVIVGLVGMYFGNSFIEEMLPLSPLRWIIRIGFVSYLTIFKPINGIK